MTDDRNANRNAARKLGTSSKNPITLYPATNCISMIYPLPAAMDAQIIICIRGLPKRIACNKKNTFIVAIKRELEPSLKIGCGEKILR
jgi:predicted ATP-grasp superfamily ATP-dependent carboligase